MNSSRLADALGVPLYLEPIHRPYWHGWGDQCNDQKRVLYNWRVTVNDIHGNPTAFVFDLVDGESPLIVGLNLKKHADTLNRARPPRICFQRPCDTSERTFYTYIAKEKEGSERQRL